MTDKQILESIARAISQDTPAWNDDLLLFAKKERNTDMNASATRAAKVIELPHQKKKATRKNAFVKWASAAAALMILLVGSYVGYGRFAVDSVIGFDVNPSIQLSVNGAEKVLSATPLNDDAKVVLEDMDLRNVDLNVAVNALMGSMLKNGYVDELKNSILISVENQDPTKSAELQQRLNDAVTSLLGAFSIDGAVLSQTVSEDDRLRTLAADNNISLGKAALVDLVVSQDARLTFTDIAALPINDINLLLSAKQTEVPGVTSSGQASSNAYIGEDKALSIAYTHAKVSASATTYARARLDYDDQRMVYEVDFFVDKIEYEYEIDAVSGQILSYDIDTDEVYTPSTSTSTTSYIGEDAAKSIALKKAGVSASNISRLSIKLDHDDGKDEYDIEFYSGNTEYDFEIDALTGEIRSYEIDQSTSATKTPVPATTSKPVTSPAANATPTPAASSGSGNYISESKAKSTAFNKAGVSSSGVTALRVKLDSDDGRMEYDVEFKVGRIEYEFEIDAVSGNILEWDSDYDDD